MSPKRYEKRYKRSTFFLLLLDLIYEQQVGDLLLRYSAMADMVQWFTVEMIFPLCTRSMGLDGVPYNRRPDYFPGALVIETNYAKRR